MKSTILYPALLSVCAGDHVHVNLTLAADIVRLDDVTFETRTFNGVVPGPVITVSPGDTLVYTIVNNLEANAPERGQNRGVASAGSDDDVDCTAEDCEFNSINQYTHPNVTNLHTHGLHVSSQQPGDDVLHTRISPGETYTYTSKLPDDHMGGTFWYHPHFHGSVALQTAGGAFGAIIVKDPKHSVPDWLRDMDEKIVLLQTLPFAALQGIGGYSSQQVGGIPPLFKVLENKLPIGWEGVKVENNGADGERDPKMIENLALVNGELMPELKLKSGEWQRWRVIYTGPFFFMDVSLEPKSRMLNGTDSDHKRSPVCEFQLLAKDGVYLDTFPRQVSRLVLPPAGRADVAVRCIGKGELLMGSGIKPGNSGEWLGDLYWNPAMATIKVSDDDTDVRAADSKPPRVLTPFSIERPAYLTSLLDVSAEDVHGHFTMNFTDAAVMEKLDNGDTKQRFPKNGDGSGTCKFNEMTYNSSTPLGRMKLGTVQEWTLIGIEGHPIHVHVNPFQVFSIAGGKPTGSGGRVCDAEFGYACVGDWQDTMMLPQLDGQSEAVMRFQTDTFTGQEVLHCHYLNHEDLGCITYFEIEK
jgi:FtsP/CotA-like multicopper oxidase with cupredoxin domain